MGYDLLGATGVDMLTNTATYATLLDRARRFGWIPMGTARGLSLEEQYFGVVLDDNSIEFATPIEGETSRGYWANDGNLVCESDATNLAIALRAYRASLSRFTTIITSTHFARAPDRIEAIRRIVRLSDTEHAVSDNESDDVTDELRLLLEPIRNQHPWVYHLSDLMLASLIGEATETWLAQVDNMIAVCENGGFAIH